MGTATLLTIFIVIWSLSWYFRDTNKYPPGPWSPIPFLGNALQIPMVRPWVDYLEWTKKYRSSILYAKAFGQPLLILNSYDDAVELLENRARKTSDRAYVVILDLMGWGHVLPLAQYGETWRKQRKMLHQSLKKDGKMLESYKPVTHECTKRFIRNLLEDGPNAGRNILKWCKRFSGEAIVSITYGYKVNDPATHLIIDEMVGLVDAVSTAVLPGAHPINIAPSLRHIPKWLPGGGFHSVAKACKENTEKLCEMMVGFSRRQADSVSDNERDSEDGGKVHANREAVALAPRQPMVVQWLKIIEGEQVQNGENQLKSLGSDQGTLKDTGLTAFAAGYDTTSTSLSWFIIAMAKFPHIQRKAQECLREVLSSKNETLPCFEDRPFLPYLEAIYMETLRWRPTVPLAIPHRMMEDDIYNGYFIPAGTLILPNIWAMTRNEEKYPDPEEFRPERFLNDDGSVKYDERILAYGFGRRICVGKYLASDSFWIAMATMLATLHISAGKDEEGNELEVVDEMTSEGVAHPTTMNCLIGKRDDIGIAVTI